MARALDELRCGRAYTAVALLQSLLQRPSPAPGGTSSSAGDAASVVEGAVRLNLGVAYQAMGQLARARREYRAALKLMPRSHHAHAALASVAQLQRDNAGATRHYAAALAIDPTYKRAQVGLVTVGLRDSSAAVQRLVLAHVGSWESWHHGDGSDDSDDSGAGLDSGTVRSVLARYVAPGECKPARSTPPEADIDSRSRVRLLSCSPVAAVLPAIRVRRQCLADSSARYRNLRRLTTSKPLPTLRTRRRLSGRSACSFARRLCVTSWSNV